MVTLEEMEAMLEELTAELPAEFYSTLNGGVLLLPEVKLDKRTNGGMCILGQYHRGGSMGRYISIYYGSFMRVFGYLDKEQMKARLRKTLRHEFTHHLESLAGERGLELKDEKQIMEYLNRRRRNM